MFKRSEVTRVAQAIIDQHGLTRESVNLYMRFLSGPIHEMRITESGPKMQLVGYTKPRASWSFDDATVLHLAAEHVDQLSFKSAVRILLHPWCLKELYRKMFGINYGNLSWQRELQYIATWAITLKIQKLLPHPKQIPAFAVD